jgi:2-oxoglutarate dehydrogenase E1 component
VAWEAQFGDFANAASVIIDQFLVAAEDKWDQTSGLVLLLPHGYEGQGPEHSSARIERFLTLCAEDNIQLANATTSAQYFHLLRRQVGREIRKPLIVFTPKSLLRARQAHSSIEDLTRGSFRETLDDPRFSGDGDGDPAAVERVVLCSGKVAHEALAYRDEHGLPAAVVRVEQLYPWPGDQVIDLISRYEQAKEVVWLQEEPENMGAWFFVHSRLHKLLRDDYSLRHVSRVESGNPATGSHAIHVQEQQSILERAMSS